MASKYTIEFKEEVVKLYLSGIPPREIVKSKNIKKLNIYDWVKQYKESSLNNENRNQKYGQDLDKFISDKILNNPYTSIRDLCKEWLTNNALPISTLTIRVRLKKLGFKYSKVSKSWILL